MRKVIDASLVSAVLTSLVLAAMTTLSVARAALVPLDTRTTSESATHRGREITDMVILGDSYTDSCNVYLEQANASLQHQYRFPTCPPPPDGRADGGRSWPEWIRIDQHQVSSSSSSPPGGSPAKGYGTNRQWEVVNLAQSGAVCDNAVFGRAVPDVGQQTRLYQTHYNTTAPVHHIYSNPATTVLALFIGTNDVTIINNGTGTVREETACIKRRLEKLHSLGFRRFLVFENIKLQDTPLIKSLHQQRATARHVRQDIEQQAHLFKHLNEVWKEGHIETFPTFALFERFYDHKSEYGFTFVNEPCGDCKNPDDHLWFDCES